MTELTFRRTPLAHDFLRRAARHEDRIGLTSSTVLDRLVRERLMDGSFYRLTDLGRAHLEAWDADHPPPQERRT